MRTRRCKEENVADGDCADSVGQAFACKPAYHDCFHRSRPLIVKYNVSWVCSR